MTENALIFDGIDDYVQSPNELHDYLGSSWTLAVQLHVPVWSAGKYFEFLHRGYPKGPATNWTYGLHIALRPSSVELYRFLGSSAVGATAVFSNFDVVSTTPTFIFVVFEYTAALKQWRVYRGATHVGSATPLTGTLKYGNDVGFSIGARRNPGATTTYDKGNLHHWSLWEGVLTSDDMVSIISGEYGAVTNNKIAFYSINEGSGVTLNDTSGNGYNASITGATWLYPSGEGNPVEVSATANGTALASIAGIRWRGVGATARGSALCAANYIRTRGLRGEARGTALISTRPSKIAIPRAVAQGMASAKIAGLVLFIPKGVYPIEASEIISRDQPLNPDSIANSIEVYVNPLQPAEVPEEVYSCSEPLEIEAGGTMTTTIFYENDDEPVIEAEAALEDAPVGATIKEAVYYALGAKITVTSPNAGTFGIVVSGKPLRVVGRELLVFQDEVSILENGIKKFEFDNPFVQDRASAEVIGRRLLDYAIPQADMDIDWRGNPALELADVVMIPEYQRQGLDQRGVFYVTKQELTFDGGLTAKLEGRKMKDG